MLDRSKPLGSLSQLTDELKNFEQLAQAMNPSAETIPALQGIDIYGESIPLHGIVGGDHLIYMDFKKRYDLDARIRRAQEEEQTQIIENLERCKYMAGIVLIDVSGHKTTDATLAAMVHQAFLMGALYELDMHGTITNRLFENLNTRLHKSSLVNRFVSALYGEIYADAHFRFLSAAHPAPLIFSCEYDRFINISPELLTVFPPLGTIPSESDIDRGTAHSVLGFKSRYEVNELKLLSSGDIMLLHTDGLADHVRGEESYFPERLEAVVRREKHASAARLVAAIKTDVLDFGERQDDITIVAIKRN